MNSESVELSTTRSCTPLITCSSSRPTVMTAVRTAPPRLTNEWSPMRSHAYCSTRTCACVALGVTLEEPASESEAVVLGRLDAVQLGVGERRVLLRVGRQHLRLVARGVRVGEVAAQRRRHVEVADLVHGRVADDPHHPVLRLAVLVRSQAHSHGSDPSRRRPSRRSRSPRHWSRSPATLVEAPRRWSRSPDAGRGARSEGRATSLETTAACTASRELGTRGHQVSRPLARPSLAAPRPPFGRAAPRSPCGQRGFASRRRSASTSPHPASTSAASTAPQSSPRSR